MDFLQIAFLLLATAFGIIIMFIDMPAWVYCVAYLASFIAMCLYSYGVRSFEDRLTKLEEQLIQKEEEE